MLSFLEIIFSRRHVKRIQTVSGFFFSLCYFEFWLNVKGKFGNGHC